MYVMRRQRHSFGGMCNAPINELVCDTLPCMVIQSSCDLLRDRCLCQFVGISCRLSIFLNCISLSVTLAKMLMRRNGWKSLHAPSAINMDQDSPYLFCHLSSILPSSTVAAVSTWSHFFQIWSFPTYNLGDKMTFGAYTQPTTKLGRLIILRFLMSVVLLLGIYCNTWHAWFMKHEARKEKDGKLRRVWFLYYSTICNWSQSPIYIKPQKIKGDEEYHVVLHASHKLLSFGYAEGTRRPTHTALAQWAGFVVVLLSSVVVLLSRLNNNLVLASFHLWWM